MSQRALVSSVLLGVVVVWGAAFSGIKILLETLDPYTLTAARLVVAGATYTVALPLVSKIRPTRRQGDGWRLVALGLTGAAGYHLAVNWGERFISAGLASLIVAAMPAMVGLLAAVFLREHLGLRGTAGVAVAFVGVAVLAASGEGGIDAESTAGALVTLLAPVAWAIYTIISKPLAARYDGVRLNVIGAWVGVLVVTPLGVGGAADLGQLGLEGWFWLIYLGSLSTAGAYIAYAWALRHWTASAVATFIYLVPAASLLSAWILLGERPSVWALVGGSIVVAGVIVVETSRQAREERMHSKIRTARRGDAEELSSLAFTSKAHWGYDAEFLEACRAELTVTAARISEGNTYLLEADGRAVGFYSLDFKDRTADVALFFIEPGFIGSGYGRELWRHLEETARRLGADSILIESDPYAQGFYVGMGAERIGSAPSGSIPGRELPLLEVRLD